MAKDLYKKEAAKHDPYAQRAHRRKYQEGYGAEGVARGLPNELPNGPKKSPKEESWDAPSPMKDGQIVAGDHAPGQLSKKNAKRVKTS